MLRCVYTCDACLVQELHARIQPLLLFYVDGASYIDAEDPDWMLFLAVKTQGDAKVVVRLLSAWRLMCMYHTLPALVR